MHMITRYDNVAVEAVRRSSISYRGQHTSSHGSRHITGIGQPPYLKEPVSKIVCTSNLHAKYGVGRSRYAEKVHLTAPRIILHDHALAYEGVILHNFVEIRQHEHIIINTL